METLISYATHEPVVAALQEILSEDPKMSLALESSLNIADRTAKKKLNKELYKAIDHVFQGNGWPTTVTHYLDYLDLYVRLIPNENIDPEYPNAWKSTNQKNGYNQKVYDLLCQFHWLIDQKIPGTNLSMSSFEKFANWLVDFSKTWGSFLDTEESLTKESLLSFKHDPMYNFPLYANDEKNWKTFNHFFYREFNDVDPKTGISPLRPIAEPMNNKTIVSPADCTYKQHYPIDGQGNVLDKEGINTRISLKGTHKIGTINELLKDSEFASEFYNGTFVHYFLSPFDYHRFHTPVSGKVLEIKPIEGKTYLGVELMEDGQWDAPDNAKDGYEFNQSRGLVIMDAGPEVGLVAILPIGMSHVSGVDMYTDLQDKNVVKGQEFGKFKFGGSDVIMLFQKQPKDLYLFKNDPEQNPIHFQYGQTAVYCK